MRKQMMQSDFRHMSICKRRSEVWQPIRDWLVHTESATVHELHRCKAEDGFRHGCQSEARFDVHRYSKSSIRNASRLLSNHLAIPCNQNYAAYNTRLIDGRRQRTT